MKADAKAAYVDALVEHARRKTRGATQPVIVNAYRFFDEACSKVDGLYHPFQKGNTKQIMEQFTDSLQAGCLSGDDRQGVGLSLKDDPLQRDFPIYVIKVTHEVIDLARHGKQAVIDSDRTAAAYQVAATVRANNPHAGWAFFSPQSDRKHPIVRSSFAVQKQRIETSRSNFNDRVQRIDPALVIDGKSTPKRLADSAVS